MAARSLSCIHLLKTPTIKVISTSSSCCSSARALYKQLAWVTKVQRQPFRCNTTSATVQCNKRNSIPNVTSLTFWSSRPVWARSAINTLRCLVGCTTGDFTMMWWLQSTHPELGMMTTMPLAMGAGIMTSIVLETTLLHLGRDRLPWRSAARTAVGMSLISMLAMESAENVVNVGLTGGSVDLGSSFFWLAAGVSTAAGFLFPLPYNYYRLRALGKACH